MRGHPPQRTVSDPINTCGAFRDATIVPLSRGFCSVIRRPLISLSQLDHDAGNDQSFITTKDSYCLTHYVALDSFQILTLRAWSVTRHSLSCLLSHATYIRLS
jgi:hypothetical protein